MNCRLVLQIRDCDNCHEVHTVSHQISERALDYGADGEGFVSLSQGYMCGLVTRTKVALSSSGQHMSTVYATSAQAVEVWKKAELRARANYEDLENSHPFEEQIVGDNSIVQVK